MHLYNIKDNNTSYHIVPVDSSKYTSERNLVFRVLRIRSLSFFTSKGKIG